ncbi:MAG: hypothetical protein ACYC6R_10505 [Anaerolineales bacterium]
MLIPIHEEMMRETLSRHFSPRALEVIIAANLKQDAWNGQIGHDEYHFDNNAIDKGNRYVIEQRGCVIASLHTPGLLSAWAAFGRLLHTAQDFYSHTNYISMWLDQYKGTPLLRLKLILFKRTCCEARACIPAESTCQWTCSISSHPCVSFP